MFKRDPLCQQRHKVSISLLILYCVEVLVLVWLFCWAYLSQTLGCTDMNLLDTIHHCNFLKLLAFSDHQNMQNSLFSSLICDDFGRIRSLGIFLHLFSFVFWWGKLALLALKKWRLKGFFEIICVIDTEILLVLHIKWSDELLGSCL